MTASLSRLIVAMLVAGIVSVANAAPTEAQDSQPAKASGTRTGGGYDGLWSVLIVTEKGTCDRGYRYPVRITRGRVGHANPELSSFEIKGQVGAGGAVKVTVSRGSQSAHGSGRLGAGRGTGRWKTGSGECSGYWTAEKRTSPPID
jgi:hypothetical protein